MYSLFIGIWLVIWFYWIIPCNWNKGCVFRELPYTVCASHKYQNLVLYLALFCSHPTWFLHLLILNSERFCKGVFGCYCMYLISIFPPECTSTCHIYFTYLVHCAYSLKQCGKFDSNLHLWPHSNHKTLPLVFFSCYLFITTSTKKSVIVLIFYYPLINRSLPGNLGG